MMDKPPRSSPQEEEEEEEEDDDDGTRQFKKLIWAFGQENQDSEFDWDRWYGEGSDVVNLSRARKK